MIREERINPMAKVRNAMHPVMWFEEGAMLDQKTADKINDMVLKPQETLETAQWIVTGSGAIMALIGLGYAIAKVVF
jgi:hypothetical protein